MSQFQWWGYLHINGNIQAKRYFDQQDIDEAHTSPFVGRVYGPFSAENRDNALQILGEAFS